MEVSLYIKKCYISKNSNTPLIDNTAAAGLISVLNVKAVVAAFNQEKA